MKLLNVHGAVPDRFYVFVGANPITRHNLEATRGFTSAGFGAAHMSEVHHAKYLAGELDYWPYVPRPGSDPRPMSMFENSATAAYRVEYNCELYRRHHPQTKTYPSRFACIYAFGDRESVQSVASMHRWDPSTVKTFRLIDHPLNRVVRVNMEVISLMRGAELISSIGQDDQTAIWRRYWSGDGDISMSLPTSNLTGSVIHQSGVIWEYLIEGRVELV